MTIEQAIDFWKVRVKEQDFQQQEFFAWCDQNPSLAQQIQTTLIADIPSFVDVIKGWFK